MTETPSRRHGRVVVDPADASPLDRPGVEAASHVVEVVRIEDPGHPDFGQAWDLLAEEFWDRGELETKEDVAALLRAGRMEYGGGRSGRYFLFAASSDGQMVAVRSCWVDLAPDLPLVLTSLAHLWVRPSSRRTGVAALLRTLPLTWSRQVAAETGAAGWPILLVAEMDPPTVADPATLVRLLAYGRAGFSVLDPQVLPYAQPEFRAEAADHLGFPLLGVVRPVGLPLGGQGDRLVMPWPYAAAFPELFYAGHRRYVPELRVAACEHHAASRRPSAPLGVPLLALPKSPAEWPLLVPLLAGPLREAYPPPLQGPPPTTVLNLGQELAGLARWARYPSGP